jgi:hypothetical protein
MQFEAEMILHGTTPTPGNAFKHLMHMDALATTCSLRGAVYEAYFIVDSMISFMQQI